MFYFPFKQGISFDQIQNLRAIILVASLYPSRRTMHSEFNKTIVEILQQYNVKLSIYLYHKEMLVYLNNKN